jgi:hypothetical protein
MCQGTNHTHSTAPGGDHFEIEIMPDGTIKTYSNKIGQANHANAEAFLKFVAGLTGGESTREKRNPTPGVKVTNHGRIGQ